MGPSTLSGGELVGKGTISKKTPYREGAVRCLQGPERAWRGARENRAGSLEWGDGPHEMRIGLRGECLNNLRVLKRVEKGSHR